MIRRVIISFLVFFIVFGLILYNAFIIDNNTIKQQKSDEVFIINCVKAGRHVDSLLTANGNELVCQVK